MSSKEPEKEPRNQTSIIEKLLNDFRNGSESAEEKLRVHFEYLIDKYTREYLSKCDSIHRENYDANEVLGALHLDLYESISRLAKNDKTAEEVEQYLCNSLWEAVRREFSEMCFEFTIPVPRSTKSYRKKMGLDPYTDLSPVSAVEETTERCGEVVSTNRFEKSEFVGPIEQQGGKPFHPPSCYINSQPQDNLLEVMDDYASNDFEEKVIRLMIEGYTISAIAEELSCNEYAVKKVRAKIAAKIRSSDIEMPIDIVESAITNTVPGEGTCQLEATLDSATEESDLVLAP